MKKVISVVLFLFFTIQLVLAKDIGGSSKSITKILGNPNSTKININQISTLIQSNGLSDVNGTNASYYYPTLSGKTANFVSGLILGAYVGPVSDNLLRVTGSAYRTSLTCGRIISPGVPDDPGDTKVRIYRVRRDYKTGSVSVEMSDETQSESQIRAQYAKDWNEWPAAWGAPFEDINKDGIYDPAIDIPGVPGADQTIWFVANDLFAVQASSFYQTTPMGVEMQCTVWGYNQQSGALGSMIFKKYTIINKNVDRKPFNNAYVTYFSDTDIGGGNYDYSGCDTTLSLFYTYSSNNTNAQYGANPPATGFDFIQGPIYVTGNSKDTAIFKNKYRLGYKNLGMTSHYYFINGDANMADPNQNSSQGITQWYNLLQGKVGLTGTSFFDPNTNKATKFALSGDPVTKTGWVDGKPYAAGDRRNGGSSGPFNMAFGDTQEVVIAQMSAGGVSGVSNLGAVASLKDYIKTARSAYRSFSGSFQLANISSPNIILVGYAINMTCSYRIANGESVVSFKWELSSKPTNSNAIFANSNSPNTSFTVDAAGTYEIKLTITTKSGAQLIDTKKITAVSNKPPIAKINLTKNEIVWGDSILVKYDQSTDPDNDALSYSIDLNHGLMNNTTKSTYVYPNFNFYSSVGKTYLSLSVSDLFSNSTAKDSFTVKPKLNGVNFSYSYIDPDWALLDVTKGVRGPYFYKGKDTLIVPTQKGLKRYQLTNTGVDYKETYPLKVDGVWGIKDDMCYTAVNGSSGYYGTIGKLSIYQLKNLSPILSNYTPNGSDIHGLTIYTNDMLAVDGSGNYNLIDISTISSPKIKASYTFTNTTSIRRLKDTDLYFYFINKYSGQSNYHITKLSRQTLALIDDFNITIPVSKNIAINDSMMVSYTNSADSVYIYRFDSFDKVPRLISSFLISNYLKKTYSTLFPYTSNSVYFLNKNSLVVQTNYDKSILDINKIIKGASSTATILAEINGFSTLYSFYSIKDNYYFGPGDNRWTVNGSYCGLNRVTISNITDIETNRKELPATFSLSQNYPNPFNPSTVIKYSVPSSQFITIKVFDILGKEVAVLVNKQQSAGMYEVNLNASKLSSGIYYYQLNGSSGIITKKMMLLK